MKLRGYQRAAVSGVWSHLRDHDTDPCVVIPTGGGKTPVIATICKEAVEFWDGRVLILAHVKELLEQAAEKLSQVCPDVGFGVYSASLGVRETLWPVIIAGVQSVYRRAQELGRFDLVLVDEAHLIPMSGEGMYRRLIAELKEINPDLRVIGFTATPYRLGTGEICTPEGILQVICHETGVRELIDQRYLCRPVSRAARTEIDTSGLHVRAGEFIDAEVEEEMLALAQAASAELVEATQERSSVLVFCAGVEHAEVVAGLLEEHGETRVVTGRTLPWEREQTIAQFKVGEVKFLVNVNVLTTGFDAPNVDCVAILRATLSPGLYYQMVGRGFRLSPGKTDFLVLDFGRNVERHGPVDMIRPSRRGGEGGPAPAKMCPDCRSFMPAGVAVCRVCGHTFEVERSAPHGAAADSRPVLSEPERLPVLDVSYRAWQKRDAAEGHPQTLRVDYRVAVGRWVSEWVCVEHKGFAGAKARKWWNERVSIEAGEVMKPPPFPGDAVEAAEVAPSELNTPSMILVEPDPNSQFERVVGYEWGETQASARTIASPNRGYPSDRELIEEFGPEADLESPVNAWGVEDYDPNEDIPF